MASNETFQLNGGSAPRRRPGPFGPASALLPKDQQPVTIEESTLASDAIERMVDAGFSQLPVRNSEGVITGVFTWKSFGKRVADLQATKLSVATLSVKDTDLESPKFISPETYIDTETDWNSLDYVLVGDARNLIGVLSISDVLGRLNDFAEAFVLLFEVEHEIRDLITLVYSPAELTDVCAAITDSSKGPVEEIAADLVGLTQGDSPAVTKKQDAATVQKAAKHLREAGKVKLLSTLEDFSFSQYKEVICSEANWPRFEPVFCTQRESVNADLDGVNKIRNVVFHFRRAITPKDTDRLRRFRNKLRYNREMHEKRFAATAGKAEVQEAASVTRNPGL